MLLNSASTSCDGVSNLYSSSSASSSWRFTFWRVDRTVLALDLLANDLAQAFGAFQAQLFGQFVVDHDFAGACHFLHGHVEDGFLAGQVRCTVVLGERHLDLLLVAGLGADELLLEAGDELAGAEHQIGVGIGAALESSPSILPT
jgi:hypothetical protein